MAAKFFSTIQVSEDGLSLTTKLQKQQIMLTNEDFSIVLGVVDNNIREQDTLAFKEEAFNHFFKDIGIPFSDIPPQFTFMLFKSFNH